MAFGILLKSGLDCDDEDDEHNLPSDRVGSDLAALVASCLIPRCNIILTVLSLNARRIS